MQADTNRVSLLVAPEAVWGETPGAGALAPRAYQANFTGESIAHNKATVVSGNIRTDRMRDALSEVGASAAGDVNFELSFRDLELFIAGAFCADYVYLIERTVSAATLTAGIAGTFTASAGTPFTNVCTGADVWIAGFTANLRNNGRFKLLGAQTSTVLTVDQADAFVSGTLTAEVSASGACTIKTPKGVFTDIAATATGITSSTTNFLTSVNLAVGQYIRVGGFVNSANNGVRQIATLAANAITFVGFATGVIEAAGPSVVLAAQRLRNGTLSKSYSLEKQFGDVGRYHFISGVMLNSMALTLESQALVTGTFSTMGEELVASGASKYSAVTPNSGNPSFNATSNVGSVTEAGVPLTTAIRTITLTIANNLRARNAVANRTAIGVGKGFVDVTGSIAAYFEDDALFTKFLAHTSTSLSFRMTDPNGNVFVFQLPKLYYTTGTALASGGNADVMVPLEFTAIRDVATNAVIQLDVLPA
jgi:hypothetical protein